MTEAERLVDELTTLLYEVTTGWDDSAGGRQIVRCGACRRRADRAESVVHESDCPVYRLIRAEEANTAVIRANAEEIADEDRRDELEAQVNALTAQMECRNELTARIRALEVENERGQQAFADLTLASAERINALTAEIERERYHVGNLNICIKNFTATCDQLQRHVETATRSVDDWREAWEQKQIELEQAEAERDALRARAERAESERDVYRDALTLISRGVWTARNSVESIVWGARKALRDGAALAAAGGEGAAT